MARKSPEELRVRRDIRRAEILIGLAHGFDGAESAGVLQRRAALQRVSLHAAALEVLAAEPAGPTGPTGPTGPSESPDDAVVTRPPGATRHLSVVPSPPPGRRR